LVSAAVPITSPPAFHFHAMRPVALSSANRKFVFDPMKMRSRENDG
jgi:hypothetical protein